MVLIQFKLAEFETYKNKLFECEVQLDTKERHKDASYDIIIDSDLMNYLDIDILCYQNQVSIGKENKF